MQIYLEHKINLIHCRRKDCSNRLEFIKPHTCCTLLPAHAAYDLICMTCKTHVFAQHANSTYLLLTHICNMSNYNFTNYFSRNRIITSLYVKVAWLLIGALNYVNINLSIVINHLEERVYLLDLSTRHTSSLNSIFESFSKHIGFKTE